MCGIRLRVCLNVVRSTSRGLETRSRRVAWLFLMRFHKHNIAVVGGGSFLRVVRIAHDGDTIDHRRFFPKSLLVIFIDVP